MTAKSLSRLVRYPVLLFILLGVVLYLPAVAGGFVWDDDSYVTDNLQLRTLGGLWRIWTQLGATPQYYPLVFTSFWAEYHLWGLNPVGYHLVNAALHGLSCGLIYLILLRIKPQLALPTAAIFLVHPVMVESVQWITERKNVLSLAFYLLSLLALLPGAAAAPGRSARRLPVPPGRYGLALALFLCAMFSKTVTCTLPATFLVICWYTDGRRWVRRLPWMLPFFVIGLVLAAVTVHTERHVVGTEIAGTGLNPLQRIMLAGRVLWFYAGKILLPWPTMFVYPRWQPLAWGPLHLLWPATATAVLVAAWAARRRIGRGPAALLFIYAGSLVPALGFIDVYPFQFSFVADHFQYLAAPALIAFYVATGLWLVRRFYGGEIRAGKDPAATDLEGSPLMERRERVSRPHRNSRHRGRAALAGKAPAVAGDEPAHLLYGPAEMPLPMNGRVRTVLLAAVLLPLVILTVIQARAYRSAESLYRDSLTKNPTAPMPHNNLGEILARDGKLAEAEAHYRAALATDANFSGARFNLAEILLRTGRETEGRREIAEAVKADPKNARLFFHIGLAWVRARQADDAIAAFKKASQLKPDYIDPLIELGNLYGQTGHPDLALPQYEQALDLNPDNPLAHANIANALASLGNMQAALEHYRIALSLDPSDAQTRENFQRALAQQ